VAVEFRCATARGRDYARELRADADRLLRAAGLPDCELSLMLVSDRAMRVLNRDFRNIDTPTDVLSFSQIEEAGATPPSPSALIIQSRLPLGDVVISIDTALRQAREFGVSASSRLRTLLIHGFLHLIGYDHERSAVEARRMRSREKALAAKIVHSRAIAR
jgi:rRNA maturation RNase YbeY